MSAPLLPTFTVSEHLLVYAFRYALGRGTGAAGQVVPALLADWHRITPYTQDQIVREITDAFKRGEDGALRNEPDWQRVLDTAEGLCPECTMPVTHCLCSHDS